MFSLSKKIENSNKDTCIKKIQLRKLNIKLEFHWISCLGTILIFFNFHMYVSIQGVYQVVRETLNDQEDVYVDGGLLCNYPIHAFDGKRYFAYSILSLNKIIYIHTRQDSIYIYILYIYIYIYIYI